MADLECIPSSTSSSSTGSFEVIDGIEVPKPNFKPEIKPKPKLSLMQPTVETMTEIEDEAPEPPVEILTDAGMADAIEAFADLQALSDVKDAPSEGIQAKVETMTEIEDEDEIPEVPEPPVEYLTDAGMADAIDAFADLQVLSEVKDAPSEGIQAKDAVPEAKEGVVEVAKAAPQVTKTVPQPKLESAENSSDVQGDNSKSHNLFPSGPSFNFYLFSSYPQY
jgi:hypothetical protein